MARIENQVCDACGRILFGKDRAARINRNALEFKAGQLKTQRVDPESGWRQYTFITPYTGAELAFCFDDPQDPLACLRGYIEAAESRDRIKREQELKDGATREHMDRLSYGPTGPDRRPAPAPKRK